MISAFLTARNHRILIPENEGGANLANGSFGGPLNGPDPGKERTCRNNTEGKKSPVEIKENTFPSLNPKDA